MDVLIIGGGATGAGIARDLSMRGVGVLLLEKDDFSSGSSGGNHGLLHSGARYVVNDPASARECAIESKVLRKVAWNCIEDTGGIFARLEEDDAAYLDKFLPSCRSAGVSASHMSGEELRELEPELSTAVAEGFIVEDASIDPFRLVLTNIDDARRHGATIRNHCEVLGIVNDAGRVGTVRYRDARNGSVNEVNAEVVVNAAGASAGHIARMTGTDLGITRDFGTLVVFNGRRIRKVVNRLRRPSDGDIVVPSHTSMVAGTTSRKISDVERGAPTRDDVIRVVKEASDLVPSLSSTRAIRAYGSSRPLASTGGGREASRGYRVIDHGGDGIDGMFSVIGGKLTTYRLMAESVSDLVCAKLGVRAGCRTGVEVMIENEGLEISGATHSQIESVLRRYGRVPDGLFGARSGPQSLEHACSCEGVLLPELDHFSSSEDVLTVADLMRRTRAGMGYCQGTGCMWPLVSSISGNGRPIDTLIKDFVKERRSSIEAVLEGDQLRQEIFRSHVLWPYFFESFDGGGK